MNHHDIHNELENLKDFKVFNVEHEWDQFLKKVDVIDEDKIEVALHSTKEERTSAKVFRLPRYAIAIAASLLILFVSTLAFLNLKQEEPSIVQQPILQTEVLENEEEVVPEKEIAEVVEVMEKPTQPVITKPEPVQTTPLPVDDFYHTFRADDKLTLADGSVVRFRETSTVKFPEDFIDKPERNFDFQSGSAIFDIASFPGKPFTIVTENSGVSILGTIFEMVKGGLETSIKTLEGEVELFSLADPTIKRIVSKGEAFKFDGKEFTEILDELVEPEQELETIDEVPEVEDIVEDEELIEPEKEEDLQMGTYHLEAICNSWNKFYGDNVSFKSKSIDKTILNDLFEFPDKYVTTGSPENITKGLELLQGLYTVDVVKTDDCEHCYKINSIKPKN